MSGIQSPRRVAVSPQRISTSPGSSEIERSSDSDQTATESSPSEVRNSAVDQLPMPSAGRSRRRRYPSLEARERSQPNDGGGDVATPESSLASLHQECVSGTPAQTQNDPDRAGDIRFGVAIPREPGEIGVYLRSFHHDESFGGGFEGDGRGFSMEQEDSARIRSSVVIGGTTTGELEVGEFSGYSDPTEFVETFQGLGDPETCIDHDSEGGASMRLRLSHAGSNPLIPFSPDIDASVALQIDASDPERLVITPDLRGDLFPNAEAFLRDHQGNGVYLDVHALAQPENVSLLFGTGGSEMGTRTREMAVLRDEQGAFTGVEYRGHQFTLAEWNAAFENLTP